MHLDHLFCSGNMVCKTFQAHCKAINTVWICTVCYHKAEQKVKRYQRIVNKLLKTCATQLLYVSVLHMCTVGKKGAGRC